MRSMVTMLPFPVSIAGAPTIAAGDLEPAFPPGPDIDAQDVWVFHSDATSLNGINGTAVTPRANTPTYGNTSMSLDAGGRNGCYLSFNDQATGTIAYIAKRPAANADQIIGGSQSNDTLAGGSSPSWSGGTLFVNTRGIVNSPISPAMAVGDWYFLIVSHWSDRRVALLGGGTPLTTSGTKIAAFNPVRPEGIGNLWYPTASYVANGIEAAGLIYWDEPKTEEECINIYVRTKLWFADLGVDIY